MLSDIESALVELLKNALPNVHILTATDLSDIVEDNQPAPAVHVIYNGFRVIETRPDGKAATIEQNWLTVVAIRNVRNRGSGASARQDAIALTGSVAAALMGIKLKGSNRPLVIETPPRPGGQNGFSYTPLSWSVETNLQAKQ